MLEYLALWAMVFALATAFANIRTFNKLIEHIKLTDNARKNMEGEKRNYEKMSAQCTEAQTAYRARLEALDKAETIAAILAGKEETK